MAATDPNNLWRQHTPGSDWPRSPRPTAANKHRFLIVKRDDAMDLSLIHI